MRIQVHDRRMFPLMELENGKFAISPRDNRGNRRIFVKLYVPKSTGNDWEIFEISSPFCQYADQIDTMLLVRNLAKGEYVLLSEE